MKQRIFLVFVFHFICLVGFFFPTRQVLSGSFIQAQELKVESCKYNPENRYAQEHPRSWDDVPCAAVIIKTPNIDGITFPSRKQFVGDVSYQDGCYYLYMTPGAYRLSMLHKDFQPFNLDMKEKFGIRVKGGETYEIILSKTDAPGKSGSPVVVFKVTPIVKGVIVCDDVEKPISSDGKVEFSHPMGEAKYVVRAENYKNVSGIVNITQATVARNVHLRPITVGVEIRCNEDDAKVYVDNVDYGKVGKLQIPLGEHQIRLQAEGYVDSNQTLLVTRETAFLDVKLHKNENRVEIHPTPIRIYGSTRKLYKNNKEIEGWRSGDIVLFMPGKKCILSDDDDNSCMFKAGTEPKTYRFTGSSMTEIPADGDGK